MMRRVTICFLVLCAIFLSSVLNPPLAFSVELSSPDPSYDLAVVVNPTEHKTIALNVEDNESHSFMWIIGELVLAVVTAILLLAIYSWHLKKVVGRKTKELEDLNNQLEHKVEARTAALKASREEYKGMYAHAEEERERASVALKSERDAIQQNLNFIDMISHEYRTPLSILSSSVEIIHRKCEMVDSHNFDDQLKKMSISIQRLVDIFDSSLGKERVDNNAPQVQTEILSLVAIISAVTELSRIAHPDHQIKVDCDDQIEIIGDKKLLITAFSNILDNGCKYSEPKTEVSINVNMDKSQVEIVTTDSGIGIDEDETHLIFEKYFRSDRTGVKQGVGVGLFLVKKIIELHEGSIKLVSERNIGTQISVYLPLAKKVYDE